MKKVSFGILQKLFRSHSREVWCAIGCTPSISVSRPQGKKVSSGLLQKLFDNYSREVKAGNPVTVAVAFGVHSGGTFPILFSKVFAGVRGRLLQKAPPARVPTAPLQAGKQLFCYFFIFFHAFCVAVIIARRLTKPRRLCQTHVAADLRFKHAVAVMLFQLR